MPSFRRDVPPPDVSRVSPHDGELAPTKQVGELDGVVIHGKLDDRVSIKNHMVACS